MALNIKTQLTENKKEKPDQASLGFGQKFTDHMFLMNYDLEKGWHDPRIVPYGPLEFYPATMVFHYGQETFEGMKAYKTKDERKLLFRPEKNCERLNDSNDRLCMPNIQVEDMLEAIEALVKVDESWIPTGEGTSLYIRPFIIATDSMLGVRPSHTYLFCIILSPVGAYYPEGVNPVKIYIENEYVRAVKGGLGFTKTGANYAASLKAQVEAQKQGYTQVLWLDGREHKYIEEVGAMNVFFKISGEVVTPALQGSILPGVTRDSVIALLKHWGIPVTERRLSVDELMEAGRSGKIEEAFGTGTAAVISPIGEVNYQGEKLQINDFKTGELSQKLYSELVGIQTGEKEDTLNWTREIK